MYELPYTVPLLMLLHGMSSDECVFDLCCIRRFDDVPCNVVVRSPAAVHQSHTTMHREY